MTVHADDDDLFNKMADTAKRLNLKGHYVGALRASMRLIYGPGDLEGHLGNVSHTMLLYKVTSFYTYRTLFRTDDTTSLTLRGCSHQRRQLTKGNGSEITVAF